MMIDRMERFPATLSTLLADIPNQDARFKPQTGAWSILEILRHLGDEGRVPRIDLPFQRMSPSWGLYTPFKQLNVDVFPAPFGPMTANSSPASIVNDMSVSAWTPLNDKLTASNSSSGAVTTTTSSCVCSA
jgi:hypothetical protein